MVNTGKNGVGKKVVPGKKTVGGSAAKKGHGKANESLAVWDFGVSVDRQEYDSGGVDRSLGKALKEAGTVDEAKVQAANRAIGKAVISKVEAVVAIREVMVQLNYYQGNKSIRVRKSFKRLVTITGRDGKEKQVWHYYSNKTAEQALAILFPGHTKRTVYKYLPIAEAWVAYGDDVFEDPEHVGPRSDFVSAKEKTRTGRAIMTSLLLKYHVEEIERFAKKALGKQHSGTESTVSRENFLAALRLREWTNEHKLCSRDEAAKRAAMRADGDQKELQRFRTELEAVQHDPDRSFVNTPWIPPNPDRDTSNEQEAVELGMEWFLGREAQDAASSAPPQTQPPAPEVEGDKVRGSHAMEVEDGQEGGDGKGEGEGHMEVDDDDATVVADSAESPTSAHVVGDSGGEGDMPHVTTPQAANDTTASRTSVTATAAPRASRRRSDPPAATPSSPTKPTSHAITPTSAKKSAAAPAPTPTKKAAPASPRAKRAAPAPAPAKKSAAAPAPARKSAPAPAQVKKSAAATASTTTTARSAANKKTGEGGRGAGRFKSGGGRVKEPVAGGSTDEDEEDATGGEGQPGGEDVGGEDESDYMSALDEEEQPQTEEPKQQLGYSYVGEEDEGAAGLLLHLKTEKGNDGQGEAEMDEDGLLCSWATRSLSACGEVPRTVEEVDWNDKEQVSRVWNCVVVLREVGRGMRRLSMRRSSLGAGSGAMSDSAASARPAHSPSSLPPPKLHSASEALLPLLEGLRVKEAEKAPGRVKSEEPNAGVAAMETETAGVSQRVLDIVYGGIIERYKELHDGLEPEAEYARTGCESLANEVGRTLGDNDGLDEAADESVRARARRYIEAHIVGTSDGKLALQTVEEQLLLDDIHARFQEAFGRGPETRLEEFELAGLAYQLYVRLDMLGTDGDEDDLREKMLDRLVREEDKLTFKDEPWSSVLKLCFDKLQVMPTPYSKKYINAVRTTRDVMELAAMHNMSELSGDVEKYVERVVTVDKMTLAVK